MRDGNPFDWGLPPEALRTDGRPRRLDAVLIESDTGPNELAIYDREDATTTEWLLAVGTDSFVSLEEMR